MGGCKYVFGACRTTDLYCSAKPEAVLAVKLNDCLFVVREHKILPDDVCA